MQIGFVSALSAAAVVIPQYENDNLPVNREGIAESVDD